jgi:hypothetical protein
MKKSINNNMITTMKSFESNYYSPTNKIIINYKCLDIVVVLDELLSNDEHEFFWKWLDRYNNDDKLDVVFPDRESWEDTYEWEKNHFGKVGMDVTRHKIISQQTIFKLPKAYNSENDKKDYKSRIKNFLNDMKNMALKSGKSWTKKDEKVYLDNVNFGLKNFEKINTILGKIYNKYSQYYKNNEIVCWYNHDGYEEPGLSIFEYPILDYKKKAIYLSELIKWIDSFEMNTDYLYEWILQNNYIEGRYWQRIWSYEFNDQTSYDNVQAPNNIIEINKLLKSLYKSKDINIYIDYYQKVDEKIFS